MFRRRSGLNFSPRVLVIILVLALAPMFGSAATMCQQEYFLFGKSMGDNSVISYVMQNTGECEWHILRKLHFTNGVLDSVQSIRYGGLNEGFTGDSKVNPEIALRLFPNAKGGFDRSNYLFGVFPTKPDSVKLRQIDSVFQVMANGDINPIEWHRHANSLEGDSLYFVQAPEVRYYDSLKLIYADPQGLYIDYKIRDVVYWPESRLMWIETIQPREMIGGDGLNGVLIYRVIK